MKKQLIDRSLVQDSIYQNTYNALKGLIDNSLLTQLTYDNHCCDDLSYHKEFCTVKMCGPRRSGRTTAMCNLAYEYFDKVIFLSPNYDMTERLSINFTNILKGERYAAVTRHTKFEIETTTGYYIFGSQNSIDILKVKESGFEAVFMDETFNMTKSKENDIYNAFGPSMKNSPQKLFVFI